MPSIIEGYSYDIFISYRQKDNKGDRWVSEFVEALKTELESTFKEEISVYFDINPHDGLLETHDVDASLKEKLKCLVFIPIISRTYCDPKSFAWEHEFKTFVDQALQDQFGLKVTLPNGNVASRVLPVRIHDLDFKDNQECESVLGGALRGVEFIYKSSGVNRPLRSKEDNPNDNLNKTFYRDQINKVALAIKEVISGLKKEPPAFGKEPKEVVTTIDKQVPKEKSIIVLPFENISPDPDQEYFCDGMTEEVITDLSKIHDILVISRNSAMIFKGAKKKTSDISKEAHVRYVLEGSVRKSGKNLRITSQLIDAETDTHLWAEVYTGTLDDIFDIQEKVSNSIVNSLKVKLSPKESKIIAQRPIDNIEAYEYYLRARQEIYRFTEEGLDRALQYLEKGLEITGENALLYSCMGNVNFQYWNLEIHLNESYLIKAKNYAERIFQIKPESHYGRVILGLLHAFNNPREAIREFNIVLDEDSYNDDALLWLCAISVFLGKTDKIDPLIERLSKTDPLNSIVKVLPGLEFYFHGEFEHALKSIRKAYQSDNNDVIVLMHYGRILASCGLIEEALSAFDTVIENCSLCPGIFSRLYGFAFRDQKQEILRFISPDIERWAWSDFGNSLFFAECLAVAGDSGNAMDWLENAVNLGFVNYPFLNEYDSFLNNIRGEKRFKRLMEQVKHEWENFEV
jgi:TolB-like protein